MTASHNGDVHGAIAGGEYDICDVAGESGEVVEGTIPGRTSASEITLAKLVGIGAQDVAAAQIVIERLAT